MRKVALVGFGPTRHDVFSLPDDFEIWTLNNAEPYEFPRIDRLFEIHHVSEINTERKHEYWEWLKSQSFPIYMLEKNDEIPTSIRYPIEKVAANVGANLIRSGKQQDTYVSTLCYMLGMAIYEKVDLIRICGFDMSTNTEHVYQREEAGHLTGIAEGRGIVVVLSEDSPFLNSKLYAYEQGQTVSRQTLEAYYRFYLSEHEIARQELNKAQGAYEAQLEQYRDGLRSKDDIMTASDERDKALSRGLLTGGAFQALRKMVDILDMQDPGPELFNPFIKGTKNNA